MYQTLQTQFDRKTGELFGKLWGPYDDKLFEESVALFTERLERIGFDPRFFADKLCLDAGCGGGRNTIAMARLGAAAVHGIDIGAQGIEDARRRAHGLDNVHFAQASVQAIPFPDATFDVVWCAGVLMHTQQEEPVLDELARVLKPGGLLYLLVYATGGLRWPLIQALKPIAAEIGEAAMEEAIAASGIPANKRRTFLDDLFVPKFDFFHWERLKYMLERRGFGSIERWSQEARLDHEHSLAAYREDLEFLLRLLEAGCSPRFGETQRLFELARRLTAATVETIGWFEEQVAAGRLSESAAMERAIGQGHHRLFGRKDG